MNIRGKNCTNIQIKNKELLKYFKIVEDFEKKYDEINKKLNELKNKKR